MSAILTFVHIVICFVLILAVLLQSGKAADLAGAFGGAGSQTAFGPRGTATLLSKVTTISAVLFMVTSMGLWMLSAKETKSVVSGEQPAKQAATTETKKETPMPAAPGQKEEGSASQEQQTKENKGEATKDATPPRKDLS